MLQLLVFLAELVGVHIARNRRDAAIRNEQGK